METYDYLILGGGMTAAAAAKGIREVDPRGSIALFSMEAHPPYKRPPLSKKLWQGKPESIIWSELPGDNLSITLNRRIVSVDAQGKHVYDEQGREIGYRQLLFATGGSPRHLPDAPDDILYYRTLDDYHTVRSWMGQGKRIGIIGGGFIGSEIAASLADNGEQVVIAFPDKTIGQRVYPAALANFVTDYYRQKGVDVRAGMEIARVEKNGSGFVMHGKDGTAIEVDHVIAGLGIRPNIELAQAAGVAIAGAEAGGGIAVNPYLCTNLPGIFAAGDVASFHNIALDRTMRVEHADNADTMGRTAGLNMAGRETAYDHQPFFYSDMFDLGYEAVGELDSRLDMYEDWRDPYRTGVVYYLKDHKVRGVLLWNTWDQVEAARRLIAAGRTVEPSDLAGRLPEA